SFSGYVHLRYLHSFPTRRSSDLDLRCMGESSDVSGEAVSVSVSVFGEAFSNCAKSSISSWRRPCTLFLRTSMTASYTMTAPSTIDRKSTRLNSSHDQISYAVFCL